MTTYIALLRGINVSGQKPVKMSALQASFKALGFPPIASYLQSGNVVFAGSQDLPSRIAQSIEAQLQKDLGFEIPVLVKSHDDWQRIVERNPFLKEKGMDSAQLYVTLLFRRPAQSAVVKLDAMKKGSDRLLVWGDVLYLHCPEGYGRSKISNNPLERVLSVQATTRNWRTVTELNRLATA